MILEDEEGPPRKRQRHSPERQTSSCRRILLEEIDLEVALRERLTSTVQSRITWALLLQEALEKDVRHPGLDSTAEFRTAALDALEAIEAPCHPIFSRDVCLPLPRPAPIASIPAREANSALAAPPSAYSTRSRGVPRAVRPPPRKLLFLRNTASYPPQLAKLACPDCSRTDFSSLQGLLNHCRLSHRREFGSHDECVQCCAVLVERAEDQAWVVANGTEVGGITIPGLRRLFEIAVGGGREVPLLPTKKAEPLSQGPSPGDATQPEGLRVTSREPSTPVSRALGHHADSPALAPFLGRAPKQRVVHAHGEDRPVDIFGDEGSTQKKTRWRMPYPHRNKARAALDEAVEPPALSADQMSERSAPASETAVPNMPGPVSRFHMMARVSVRDMSFWTPPSKRDAAQPEHTHRWRLAVSSPSYSLPLNTILKKMTIRSVTDPPPTTLLEPITLDKPPFVVTSTTDKPFLARITFEWVGADGQNPPLDVEHWVELDPLRRSHAVLGDEQVFDVGLDRSTELLPVQDKQEREVSWEMGGVVQSSDLGAPSASQHLFQEEVEPASLDYAVRLKSLVPQFPLTMRGATSFVLIRHLRSYLCRRLSSRRIPYTLVATPAQLRNLIDGRRKAIEWGRALALRQAYEELCASEPWPDGRLDIPLITGDVFRWLEDEGLFLRQARKVVLDNGTASSKAKKQTIKPEEERSAGEYCRHCGLYYLNHPAPPSRDDHEPAAFEAGDTKLEPTAPATPHGPLVSSMTCPHFHNEAKAADPPVIDVNRLLTAPIPQVDNLTGATYGLHSSLFGSGLGGGPYGENFSSASPRATARDLLRASDPKLVLAIQDLAAKWKLDRLCMPAADSPPSLLHSEPKEAREGGLAPAALLALAARSLVGTLTKSAVAELRGDEEAGLREVSLRTRPQRAEQQQQRPRLLTPAHVARGLARDGATVAACGAMLLAVAPLGIALPPVNADGDEGAARAQ
ncbi:uncharacterized protein PHACADRAFT_31601 [Phanerochaete carnosa HHB-10118-sp]|uniref:YEATS domain-containing protein n=1 Tax=Phanerochaete carnosa (strain HHB-10118-sp) TaxID=650164 RepID=K5VKA1_PHACS|nr:uncharacterized protein PHACADRAFT_31601 [Phanerochaete carnosa HHB-10118-sp]EKM51788.1 hypothetical protein PHACADRAFT_31601 [Phanerochaete carnosa HHB-10118-sp]